MSMYCCSTEALCRYTIPTFIGVARALGRVYSSGAAHGSLLCLLFPVNEAHSQSNNSSSARRSLPVDCQRRTFNTFRSIVPRTLSMSILSSSSPSPPRTNDVRSTNSLSGRHRSPSPIDYGIVLSDDSIDNDFCHDNPSQHYLCIIGATFPQVFKSSSATKSHLLFTAEQLEGILILVRV